VHDEAQVRQHQFARRVEIIFRAVTDGQVVLFLARQDRDAADAIHIRIQAPQRSGESQV